MKNLGLGIIALAALSACSVQKNAGTPNVKDEHVARIIRTLSSDEMEGRGTFTPGIDRAATFIENEFKSIGLQPLKGATGFRQEFSLNKIVPGTRTVSINGKAIESSRVMAFSDAPSVTWQNGGAEVIEVQASETFFDRYRAIMRSGKSALVFVPEQHADAFRRLAASSLRSRVVQTPRENVAVVFVLGEPVSSTYSVQISNTIEKAPLFNVAGMLPGKSKAQEIVVFSGHYDHLGIIKPNGQDSIANGADDDASGTTAVIELARHFKKLNNNERTLIFVAFTAEEIGGYGSQYFSKQLNPDNVVAMFNIEMIGKESKFGKNNAFITGYERSDFGEILQKNLSGTDFKFYPDPYPKEQLFYRSDNATLAALGVPAHTISTVQIDMDKNYHTVDDELETLDVNNITATIKAIALSSRTIVAGTDTPKRIPKLEGRQ